MIVLLILAAGLAGLLAARGLRQAPQPRPVTIDSSPRVPPRGARPRR